MLKKLASPKRKSLAPAAFGAIGEDQGSADQGAASTSDEGKDKSRTKEKKKKKVAEKEKEEPQQGSPSKADADAKSDALELKETKAAAHVPVLERRPRRRSVLEETPSKQDASTKDAGKRKSAVKKPKSELAHESKAIQEEEGEAEATEAQENQAVEQGAALSDAASDSKPERGFLKSLAQATRGHRASSSSTQQEAAGSPAKGRKKTPKEGQGDKQGEHTPSSSPSKQQKSGKSGKKSGKQRETADDATDNNAGEATRRGGRAKETAAPVSGHLSPIRRRPPPRSEAAATRPSAVANQLAPLSQPEMHLIGEVIGGGGFSSSGDGLVCKWHVEFGSLWHHVAGHQLGQTQVAYPSPTAGFNQREDDAVTVVWAHPIDVHLAMSAFQGWPKLVLQVWRVDKHMSTRVAGYGFVAVPFAAGEHELRVRLWRPVAGSWVSELGAKLTGNTPELVTDDVVFRSAIADRCRLETVATGSVSVRIGIILRNLDSLREGLGR